MSKARIPLGVGFYDVGPAFGTLEAIAVDEGSKTIFLGDEANAMIHVLTPLRLAADFNSDRVVDCTDLGQFFSQRFAAGCNLPRWCNGADLTRDEKVDFADFAAFAQEWLEQGL